MPIENDYYTAAGHGPFELFNVGDLVLEEGVTLRGCQLAYATFGTLNQAKDNAILVPTWYSGNHGVMRSLYIADTRALDPSQYFIVVVNQIGSGLGTSPHNTGPPFGRGAFPHVRIGDDVVAQERLLRLHFGIDRLALVVGASMGAQQTYEWAVRFPDKVCRAAPIAATAKLSTHTAIFVQTLIDTMVTDPAYQNGFYHRSDELRVALNRHAGLFAVYGLSREFWLKELWRGLGFASPEDFHIGFLQGYFAPMDVGDLVTQAWKWQHADVSRHTGGDLAAALARITATTFVIPFSTDLIFPVADCAAEQALIPGSQLRVIDDDSGHLALFHLQPTFAQQIDQHLNELLAT
jgi:homoserine O-acetyltransferase